MNNIWGQESLFLIRAGAQLVKRATRGVLPISLANQRIRSAGTPQISSAHSGVFGTPSYVPRT